MRAFEPIRKRVPKINEDQAAALIRRNWQNADGSELSEDQAQHWVHRWWVHLHWEPTMPPRNVSGRSAPRRSNSTISRGWNGTGCDEPPMPFRSGDATSEPSRAPLGPRSRLTRHDSLDAAPASRKAPGCIAVPQPVLSSRRRPFPDSPQGPSHERDHSPAAQHSEEVDRHDHDGDRSRHLPRPKVYRGAPRILDGEEPNDSQERKEQDPLDDSHDRASSWDRKGLGVADPQTSDGVVHRQPSRQTSQRWILSAKHMPTILEPNRGYLGIEKPERFAAPASVTRRVS